MKFIRSIKKLRHAFWILRKEGLLSLSIISLTALQKRRRKLAQAPEHKQKIYVVAKYSDILTADPFKKRAIWEGTNKQALTFNWIMPPPGKGSGGHLNIFRFIKYLEQAGHKSRIYMYTQGQHGPVSGVREAMGNSYPVLKASMEWLEEGKEMEEADGIFATSWETAYPAYNSKLKAKRFYFVQDFEPFFYPVGSLSTLAENTYKLGFFGITAGGWLANKLRDYGMKTDYFNFSADKELYNFKNDSARKEIFCYVRPFTERRGFEFALMALDLFHRKHPDYKINLAGWDVSHYDIHFPYTNLKTLEIHELNEVYNRCAAGLVLSFTNMSLLPLELLGSGAIPVVNDGENNRLVSNNPYIAYTAADPVSISQKLSEVVERENAPKYARNASASVESSSWDDSGKKFVAVIERETRGHE